MRFLCDSFAFFFNDTATTEIYTLSLHDALPISTVSFVISRGELPRLKPSIFTKRRSPRSEEHTSELQSRRDLVCRLLLEKKKKCEGSDARLHAPERGVGACRREQGGRPARWSRT